MAATEPRNSRNTHTQTDSAFVTLLWNAAGHYYANEQTQTLVNHCVCLHGTVRTKDMVQRV